MSRFNLASALALFVLALSTGCGNSAGSRLIGKWEADTTQVSKTVDEVAAQAGNPFGGVVANMTKGALQSMKVELDFKPQNQMTFSIGVMGQSRIMGGTWKVKKASGNDVTIAVKMEGEATERESTITFVDNDTIEMIVPAPVNAGAQQKTTLRRVKAT